MPRTAKKNLVEWSEAEKAAWRLPDALTVSQWADRFRMLDARSSSEPGLWRTERTAYLKGPMDAFTDPEVEEITLVLPPQSGKTECMFNMLAYVIDQDPSPTLYMMPRDEDCEYIAENRIKPMVNAAPALRAHLTGRPWDLKKSEFYFDRMTLYYAGSNSPAGYSSRPVRYLFRDEINKWPSFAGKDVDPIKGSEMRTITFWDRKIVNCSTPTKKQEYISQAYHQSNMQQYYVPCPFCGHYQLLIFANLKVEPAECRDADLIRRTKNVYYQCQSCQQRIEEQYKARMTALGVWCPEGQTVGPGGKLLGHAKKDKRHSGYHISAMLSPWVGWAQIMAEFFEATSEQGILLGKLMAFKTQRLAEPWEESSRVVKANELEQKRGDFSRGTVPDDCMILVAGADYHEDTAGNKRIDYEVRGFGYEQRNWVISSGSVGSFEGLSAELFATPYPWSNPAIQRAPLSVMLLCIDSGYKPDEVYQFCVQWRGLAVPIKGHDTQRMPVAWSQLDRSVGKFKGVLQLGNLDVSFFKDMVARWADTAAGSPGSTAFYAECPPVYFAEFCNEHKVKGHDKFGRIVENWEPVSKGAPTHFLDTAVYAAAAGYIKNIQYMHRPGQQQQIPQHYRKADARPQTPGERNRQQHGFLGDMPKL